jgi:hypothetical protein
MSRRPTAFGHIPEADRSIVLKKQVTSLRSCLETLRQTLALGFRLHDQSRAAREPAPLSVGL